MCHSQWIAPSGKWKSMIWHQDTGSWLLTLGHLAPWYGHQVSHHCHLNGSAESVNRNLHSVKFTHWNPWDPAVVWLKSILGYNSAPSDPPVWTWQRPVPPPIWTQSSPASQLRTRFDRSLDIGFIFFVKTVAAFLSSSPCFTFTYQGCFNLPVQLPIIGQFFLWSSGRAQLGTEGLPCQG